MWTTDFSSFFTVYVLPNDLFPCFMFGSRKINKNKSRMFFCVSSCVWSWTEPRLPEFFSFPLGPELLYSRYFNFPNSLLYPILLVEVETEITFLFSPSLFPQKLINVDFCMGNLTMTSETRKCIRWCTIRYYPTAPKDKFNSFTPPCKEIFMFDAVPKQLGYVKELQIVCSSLHNNILSFKSNEGFHLAA